MRAFFLALAILVSAVGVSWGYEQGLSEEARREIKQRGNKVEVVDGNVAAFGFGDIRDVLGVPPSDAHKFVLNVIVADASSSPAERAKSDQLKRELEASQFVKLERIRQSNGTDFLQSSDQSFLHVTFETRRPPGREERFAALKITTLPVLVLKPSLNGQWGDPAQVIRQLDYQGARAAAIDAWLQSALTEHARKYWPTFQAIAERRDTRHQDLVRLVEGSPYGPCPYPPAPQPQPLAPYGPAPLVLPIDQTPVPPPAAPTTSTTGLWATIFTLGGALGISGLIHMAVVGWGIYRMVAKSQGKQLLLSDEEYERVKQVLGQLQTPRPAA